MDSEEHRRQYFVEPAPVPRFAFAGIHGAALFYEDFDAAIAFYAEVLGPPAYVQGAGTCSWRVGETWLTLLRGRDGNPKGVEVPFITSTPAEAERLQRAFIEAGATGPEPSDQLMAVPIRYCPVRDPFGVDVLVYCPNGEDGRAGT